MATNGVAAALLCIWINMMCFCSSSASDSYPRAQNVTWKSTNFKTELTWQPKASADYSYTVEFSVVGENRERNPHCIRTAETLCDLSSSLTQLRATYTADVLSEPPRGALSDLTEFPYTSAARFCPYTDTDIGSPKLEKMVANKAEGTLTLYVADPLTAVFEGGRQLTIRDIFSDELQYRVHYRKAGSSGTKKYDSKTSEIELKVDRGERYCVSLQAYIPSRSSDKQLGEISIPECTKDDDQSIFELYSVGVIAGAIFLILLIVAVIIAVTVVCLKKRRGSGDAHPAKDPGVV